MASTSAVIFGIPFVFPISASFVIVNRPSFSGPDCLTQKIPFRSAVTPFLAWYLGFGCPNTAFNASISSPWPTIHGLSHPPGTGHAERRSTSATAANSSALPAMRAILATAPLATHRLYGTGYLVRSDFLMRTARGMLLTPSNGAILSKSSTRSNAHCISSDPTRNWRKPALEGVSKTDPGISRHI